MGKLEIKKPNRVSHTYVQTIHGTVDKIMPLYCPVKELDWCENWDPKLVLSKSGVVEKDCVFITMHNELEVTWVVTEYDLEKGRVEMFYLVPGILVTKLEIQVEPINSSLTRAELTYSKTSLGKMGDKHLESFTKEKNDIMMDSWEKAMNHYLKTGEMLCGLPNF